MTLQFNQHAPPAPRTVPRQDTTPSQPAPTSTTPTSLEGLLAAAWTEACGTNDPPVGWLTRTTAAITAHMWHDIDRARQEVATPALDARAPQELVRLRRQVREQLAGAVMEGHLDGDLANGMLEQFGLPLLTRTYTVRIAMVFTVEVSATHEEEAYDLAEDAVTAAARDADGVLVDHDAGDRIEAEPGGFDDAGNVGT